MSCECDLCRRRELHPGVYPEKRADAEQEIVDDVYARYYSNDPELADSQGFAGGGTAVAWDNDGKGLAYDQADHVEHSKLYNEAAYNDYKSWEEKDVQLLPTSVQSAYAKFQEDWAPGGEKNPRGYIFPVMTAISTGHSPPGSVFTIEEAIQKSIDEGLAKLHAVEAATGVRHVFVHDPERAYGMKLVPAETRRLGTCIRHGRTICLVCACAEGNANE